EYLAGLIRQDDKVLRAIYQNFAGRISNYILQKGGSSEDAKDIFQDGLTVIYKMTQKRQVILTSSFLTFLHSICRRLWWSKLRKRKQFVQFDEVSPNALKESSFEKMYLAQERYNFYQEKMQDLPAKQRQVLELYLEGKKMREIAVIAGLKNESYAKKYKYKCKQLLLQSVARDGRFAELVC
ncbi:MAG: RNA polymerase sigma factor, partial [Chitinophagales bacterium]